MDPDEPIVLPIDGVLDLHTFQPKEIKPLLRDYVEACLEEGIYELLIIHGKGQGVLRRLVHSALEKMPEVESFNLADEASGGWGATQARLKAPSK
ncbi:DNA mismatch repair protein MutS [Desulfocarbo indianensis]|nr:DNA mismatch repair protein MutS [Desulfocarbo indianensis]